MSSRARPVAGQWFDVTRNGLKATAAQLETLASVEDIDLDDLLDANLSQGEVITRLRVALGQGTIPEDVLERQRQNKTLRRQQPECRICGRPGNSTRHHFVNRWIMRELSNYPAVGARSRCTIPVCTECHRDLHIRDQGPVSIVPYLKESEKYFANLLIERLRQEHPKIFGLLLGGSPEVYESRLIQDWNDGRLDTVRRLHAA